ncbi:unnamed protein product [Tetraodon nigroviridis]|uniref:(spotted green pufferfish) hypothetical protein n=1 Tax=Tetraodon nigroviridis TaxID=99883 RepID=Q4SMM7_TETNG|nr:unnamed protein product [Tetraodon nigroviridis]
MRVYLVLLCLPLLQPEGRVRPDSAGCSSPEALRMAEEALEQVNQDRTDGYILSLNRLYDISHTPETEGGALVYKLSIDVMETECHIISRKPWKQCEVKSIAKAPVYGECEMSIYVDSEVKLQSYTCALREVPATAILDQCPDCPTADDVNTPVVKDTANLSLQKFNKKSSQTNYFRLENVTRASSQWVDGPAYFVEFTIVETVCSKKTDPGEVKNCPPMDCRFTRRGFCFGSHVTANDGFPQQNVEVKCEIFNSQGQAHAEAGSKDVGQQPTADPAVSCARSSRGTVVNQPAPVRSSPAARSCPSPHRHNIGISNLGF